MNRYLAIWGDHSSILNSGYLLYTVKVIYTKDTFFTDEEMWDKFKKRINVQSIVEQPEIYLVAQCQDSIAEKLSYVDNRREDIADISELCVGDIRINDTMRFFTGLLYFVFSNALIKLN